MLTSRLHKVLAILILCAVTASCYAFAPAQPALVQPVPPQPEHLQWPARFAADNPGDGVGDDPLAWQIGGGVGYDAVVARPVRVVSTKAQLLDALARAARGDVVYVDDRAEIDLSGVWKIDIPAGVTLASGRGHAGSQGALLYTTESRKLPLFSVRNHDVRITGLRLRGPTDDPMPPGCPEDARAIEVQTSALAGQAASGGPDVVVDNNELYAWSNSAIHVIYSPNVYIHHNHIHHNRRIGLVKPEDSQRACPTHYGLGYGVNVSGAHVYIDANLFDHNRHDIASNGEPGSGYTARYNLILPNAQSEEYPANVVSHSFDMHGYGEQASLKLSPPYTAGHAIYIHHNTFLLASDPAIVIRGIPKHEARIYRNEFVRPQELAIWQRYVVSSTAYITDSQAMVNIFDVPDNRYTVIFDVSHWSKLLE